VPQLGRSRRARRRPMPVVGVLGSGSPQFKEALAAGLKESGLY
jgi:hypothetical protein